MGTPSQTRQYYDKHSGTYDRRTGFGVDPGQRGAVALFAVLDRILTPLRIFDGLAIRLLLVARKVGSGTRA